MHQKIIDLIITSDIAFKSTAKRNNTVGQVVDTPLATAIHATR